MNPSRITDPKKADLAIEIWEDHIGKLDSGNRETSSGKIKMAVLYAMLAKDLPEQLSGKCAVSWDKAKEQEAALISSKGKEEIIDAIKKETRLRDKKWSFQRHL